MFIAYALTMITLLVGVGIAALIVIRRADRKADQ
jgi:hypothetical protein